MMAIQHIIKKISTKILACLGLLTCWACNSTSTPNSSEPMHTTGDRVEVAYKEKYPLLEKRLVALNIKPQKLEIFLRAIKEEEVLEVWGKNKEDKDFKHIKSYPFCTNSGTLGPKRKEGDRQIPEGIYFIDRFNPQSSFYLSLGINYPNQADRILGDPKMPGSDIFIHGACVSVGCISITDDKIKEVYTLANMALAQGQTKIPVHIFPMRLTAKQLQILRLSKHQWQKHLSFWEELAVVYQYFEQYNQLPSISINQHTGKYILQL